MSEERRVRRVFVRAGRGESYPIEIGAGVLARIGPLTRESFDAPPRRVALVSNRRVFGLYGEKTLESLRAAGFEVKPWLMGDGEPSREDQSDEPGLGIDSLAARNS